MIKASIYVVTAGHGSMTTLIASAFRASAWRVLRKGAPVA
jgi:hypothetical protein